MKIEKKKDQYLCPEETLILIKECKSFCKEKYKKEEQYHIGDIISFIYEYLNHSNKISAKGFRKYLENNQ